MPLFHYKGFRNDGTQASGRIEAAGANDAALRVRADGIFPSEIVEAAGRRRRLFERGNESFLPNMTRQLSTLLGAGVPLMDALASLAVEYHGREQEMLIAIRERISGGAGFARALEEFGHIFPEFYCSMVQAGEESGSLDRVLYRLAEYLERQSAVKAKVRMAMIYPLIMAGVAMIALAFLFSFVVPKIVKIFNDTKAVLPLVTRVLIFVSNLFVNYWWALLGVTMLAVWFGRRFVNSHRPLVDALLLRLPGNVVQSLAFGRFARTLGFLLGGGLSMLKALGLAARSTGNSALEARIGAATEKVVEGQRLSASLEGFPPIFLQLVSAGEKSGKLSESLTRAADAYEEEFNRKVTAAVSILEPLMILGMGLLVGFIVLAILLPMFQLNQIIR